jgi:uncharacterized protein YndB with AHSA1/START domain
MAPKTQTLKIKCVVDASPEAAYRAFASDSALLTWFCDAAQIEAKKGGRFYAWWNSGYYAAGQVFAAVPGKRLAFTWRGRGEPDETQVKITFSGGQRGTTVTLAHSGIWSGRKWAEAVGEFERGWQVALDNLKSVLETGQDLRIVRRPMLGISVGDFNAEARARLGVPVSEGVLVDSTVESMGAHAAGLRKDDVIVNIGGRRVSGFNSVGRAVQRHHAGSRVSVVFYRGAEKMTVMMELSRRPIPEIPPTAAGLAEALRAIQARVNAELDKVFEGVTDAEASFKSTPDAWSAKETLAHLLTGERDNQLWLTGLATNQEVNAFVNNFNPRYAALAASHEVAGMVETYKRNEAETAALVAALPPEFVANKGLWWRLGFNLLQPLDHTFDHFQQIREAIQAARSASRA